MNSIELYPEINPQEPSIHAGSEALVPLLKIWGTKWVQRGQSYRLRAILKAKKEPPGRRPFFGINPGFMRVCGPYFSASDTATAQATVAPTIGLLPLWDQV